MQKHAHPYMKQAGVCHCESKYVMERWEGKRSGLCTMKRKGTTNVTVLRVSLIQVD